VNISAEQLVNGNVELKHSKKERLYYTFYNFVLMKKVI